MTLLDWAERHWIAAGLLAWLVFLTVNNAIGSIGRRGRDE